MKISRVDPERFAQVITQLHETCFIYDAMCALEGSWWIAFEGKQPVGFAACKDSHQWDDTMYLSRCGVIESHRGKGLQRRLIQVRERFARAQGKRWLVTDTRQNPHSANNLIRSGFTIYEPAKPWSWKDTLYWKKQIDNQRNT